jgi:endonuclease/exonuclease/phosphatase family metal-dependent hydrolase
MRPRHLAESIIPIITLLFFLQALRVIFSVLFGFIYDQVFEGPANAWLVISNVLVLFAFALPAWVNRKPSWRWMSATAIIATSARVALSINDPWVRYLGALLIIASAGVFMVPLIRLRVRGFIRSLVIALILEQLLRVLGHTTDASLEWEAVPILAIWIVVLMTLIFWAKPWSELEGISLGGISWGMGAAFGGFLFLETSLLGLPNAVARWSGISYTLVAPLLLILMILPLYPGVLHALRRTLGPIFIRSMVVIISIGGVLLGYFMSGVLSFVLLLVSQGLTLSILLLAGEMLPPVHDRVGGRLAAGFFFFLLLNFMNAFAFTYPYTLTFMRGMGWLVYLAGGLLIAWGLHSSIGLREEESGDEGAFRLSLATVLALAIVLIAIWPVTNEAIPEGTRRFASYNIHYGYDDDWHTTLPDIAAALKEADVDVVAMQEVDTGRLTSYSADDAYYLARTLGMNVYYLPTVEHLTGIAVLYKGEAIDWDARLVASLQEQTGVIEIVLPWQERRVHSYGIWMGLANEDTMRQVEEALAFIGSSTPATFGGDFNARIDEPEMQAVIAAGFVDPFSELGQIPAPPTSPAIDPESRIDFIWLRGLKARRAWISDSLASDHRLVIVELEPP